MEVAGEFLLPLPSLALPPSPKLKKSVSSDAVNADEPSEYIFTNSLTAVRPLIATYDCFNLRKAVSSNRQHFDIFRIVHSILEIFIFVRPSITLAWRFYNSADAPRRRRSS